MFAIHESDGAITFAVRVHPRAKKNDIAGELDGANLIISDLSTYCKIPTK